jgi:hypothetical protein
MLTYITAGRCIYRYYFLGFVNGFYTWRRDTPDTIMDGSVSLGYPFSLSLSEGVDSVDKTP